MRKLIIILLLFSGISLYSQYYNTNDYSISFSGYSSLDYSKGFEIRGEFTNWYVAFQGENFVKDKEFHFNWGGALGLMRSYKKLDFFGGVRVGFIHIEDGAKPSFGLELETDYRLSNTFFVGIRGAHDIYFNSPHVTTPNSESFTRLFVKFGLKF